MPACARRLQISVLIMFMALSLLGGSSISKGGSGNGGSVSISQGSKVRKAQLKRVSRTFFQVGQDLIADVIWRIAYTCRATTFSFLPDQFSNRNCAQIAGIIIAPVAFIFVLYALFMYKKRTIQARTSRGTGLEAPSRPALAECACLVVCVFVDPAEGLRLDHACSSRQAVCQCWRHTSDGSCQRCLCSAAAVPPSDENACAPFQYPTTERTLLPVQILRRDNVRYDDQRGPVLLVLILACALVATTIITARSAFS